MKILVSPLDWGLGHATRCIPLIRALLGQGHEVVLAASGGGERLLRGEFPDLVFLPLPAVRIRYARRAAFLLPSLLLQLPGFLYGIRRERRALSSLIRTEGLDLIISDNRYGLYSSIRPSVFITHQLSLRAPAFLGALAAPVESLLRRVHLAYLRRFSRIWVPDLPGRPNLSGRLSHGFLPPRRVHFIGLLARFSAPAEAGKSGRARSPQAEAAGADGSEEEAFNGLGILGLVSGPEPQRSLFEEILRRQLRGIPGRHLLLCGRPAGEGERGPEPDRAGSGSAAAFSGEGGFAGGAGMVEVRAHLGEAGLAAALQAARLVVCRPGYTSVMELCRLRRRRMLFVPTPGQTEQEYLARYLEAEGIAPWTAQDRLDLARDGDGGERFTGFASPAWRADDPAHLPAFLMAFFRGEDLPGGPPFFPPGAPPPSPRSPPP